MTQQQRHLPSHSAQNASLLDPKRKRIADLAFGHLQSPLPAETSALPVETKMAAVTTFRQREALSRSRESGRWRMLQRRALPLASIVSARHLPTPNFRLGRTIC